MDVTDSDLSKLQVGCYVKIFGMIRQISPNKDEGMRRMINIVKIRPCASLNLVSQHMLECSRAKTFYLTTAKRLAAAEEGSDSNKSNANNSSSLGSGSAVATPIGESGLDGLTHKQDKVFMFLKSCNPGDVGVNVKDVISKLSPHGINERDVRDALEFLSSQGHIYTTLDEDTYTIIETS